MKKFIWVAAFLAIVGLFNLHAHSAYAYLKPSQAPSGILGLISYDSSSGAEKHCGDTNDNENADVTNEHLSRTNRQIVNAVDENGSDYDTLNWVSKSGTPSSGDSEDDTSATTPIKQVQLQVNSMEFICSILTLPNHSATKYNATPANVAKDSNFGSSSNASGTNYGDDKSVNSNAGEDDEAALYTITNQIVSHDVVSESGGSVTGIDGQFTTINHDANSRYWYGNPNTFTYNAQNQTTGITGNVKIVLKLYVATIYTYHHTPANGTNADSNCASGTKSGHNGSFGDDDTSQLQNNDIGNCVANEIDFTYTIKGPAPKQTPPPKTSTSAYGSLNPISCSDQGAFSGTAYTLDSNGVPEDDNNKDLNNVYVSYLSAGDPNDNATYAASHLNGPQQFPAGESSGSLGNHGYSFPNNDVAGNPYDSFRLPINGNQYDVYVFTKPLTANPNYKSGNGQPKYSEGTTTGLALVGHQTYSCPGPPVGAIGIACNGIYGHALDPYAAYGTPVVIQLFRTSAGGAPNTNPGDLYLSQYTNQANPDTNDVNDSPPYQNAFVFAERNQNTSNGVDYGPNASLPNDNYAGDNPSQTNALDGGAHYFDAWVLSATGGGSTYLGRLGIDTGGAVGGHDAENCTPQIVANDSCSGVYGYAYDPADPTDPLTVQMFHNTTPDSLNTTGSDVYRSVTIGAPSASDPNNIHDYGNFAWQPKSGAPDNPSGVYALDGGAHSFTIAALSNSGGVSTIYQGSGGFLDVDGQVASAITNNDGHHAHCPQNQPGGDIEDGIQTAGVVSECFDGISIWVQDSDVPNTALNFTVKVDNIGGNPSKVAYTTGANADNTYTAGQSNGDGHDGHDYKIPIQNDPSKANFLLDGRTHNFYIYPIGLDSAGHLDGNQPADSSDGIAVTGSRTMKACGHFTIDGSSALTLKKQDPTHPGNPAYNNSNDENPDNFTTASNYYITFPDAGFNASILHNVKAPENTCTVTVTVTSVTPVTPPSPLSCDTSGASKDMGTAGLAIAGPNGTVPPTFTAGDQYCSVLTVAESQGILQSDGHVYNPTGSITRQGCDYVTNKPYFKVYGAGVSAGGDTENTAGTGGGALGGWYDNEYTDYGFGASAQLNALALTQIAGFASNQTTANTTSTSAQSFVGQTFANNGTGVVVDPQSSNPHLGGEFGAVVHHLPSPGGGGNSPTAQGVSFCDGSSCPASNGIYSYDSTNPSNAYGATVYASQLATNHNVSFFSNGDVYINGNITYDSGGWSASNVPPSFTMEVTGNIYISPDVTELDGIYTAIKAANGTGGNIYTCATNTGPSNAPFAPVSQNKMFNNCNVRLKVYGSFVAGGKVALMRTYGSLRDEAPVAASVPASGYQGISGLQFKNDDGQSASNISPANFTSGSQTCTPIKEPSESPSHKWYNDAVCYDTSQSNGFIMDYSNAKASAADAMAAFPGTNNCVQVDPYSNPPYALGGDAAANGAHHSQYWYDNWACSNLPLSMSYSGDQTNASTGKKCVNLYESSDTGIDNSVNPASPDAWQGSDWLCVQVSSVGSVIALSKPDIDSIGQCQNDVHNGINDFQNSGQTEGEATCAAEVFFVSPEMYLSGQGKVTSSSVSQNIKYDAITSLPPVL